MKHNVGLWRRDRWIARLRHARLRAGVLIFFDSGHQMPPEYADTAIAWLLQYLKR